MIPFNNCFAVDIDFCKVGFKHALEVCRRNGIEPTVIWCSNIEETFDWVLYVQRLFQIELEVRKTSDYLIDQWSLGTSDNYGYGSRGSS